MLSVAGGKYTTFRRIAIEVVRALAPELGLHALDEHPAPLADAADPDAMAALLRGRSYGLTDELARHLARLYGAAAPPIAAMALDDRELSSRCTRPGRISARRSCGPATRSGRSRSTTSCDDAPR